MKEPAIKIIYVKKRHSSASVKNGEILLRISSLLTSKEREEHIQQLLRGILPKFHRTQTQYLLQEVKKSGASNFVHRGMIPCKISYGVGGKFLVTPHAITFFSPLVPPLLREGTLVDYGEVLEMKEIQGALLEYAKTYLLEYVSETVREWAGYVGADNLKKVDIRLSETRWGSCSSKGAITISLKTLLLPEELFEYVCVHEVCHLLEMNHSEKFWKEVGAVMPNWKALRGEMKGYQ